METKLKQDPGFPFDFKLDPYEQEIEDECARLDAAGLLKSTLTPAIRKEIQEAARNTLAKIAEDKKRAALQARKKELLTPSRVLSTTRHSWNKPTLKKNLVRHERLTEALIS